ncbi:MAG TPA: hypothetical protein VMW47_12785 [Verrucomicrobiae bacterium]|nr:hypothetical protein [Verrucomicrobiae bacterium]
MAAPAQPNQQVERACHHLDVLDLGDGARLSHRVRPLAGLRRHHPQVGHQHQLEAGPVDLGAVAADHSGGLPSADPLRHRGRGQAHLGADPAPRGPRVAKELDQDRAIGGVGRTRVRQGRPSQEAVGDDRRMGALRQGDLPIRTLAAYSASARDPDRLRPCAKGVLWEDGRPVL